MVRAAVDGFFSDLKNGCNNIMGCEEFYKSTNAGKKFYVMDIRKPEDFDAGHIEGAMNIPWAEVGECLDDLPRDEKIIVACYSGQTAGQTVSLLKILGFNACSLKGGMSCDQTHLPIEATCSC